MWNYRESYASVRLMKTMRAMLGCVLSGMAMSAAESGGTDDVNESIRRHRMGTIVVETTPGAAVKVEQVRHAFWFGAALANQAFDGTMPAEVRERYLATFRANFNSAVTENALKWLSMQPKAGPVNYDVVNAMLAWTDEQGIPLRGHNIYWGIEKFVPQWLKELDDAQLRAALEARARDVGRRYRGRFAEYDLNNEMIHGNYFADRLGNKITLEMAKWVKAEDPAANLYLNDYDITTGRKLNEYVQHIEELRGMQVPIDGIGVQGHLHAETFDRGELQRSLDELAKFGLPIRVTEFNIPGQRSKYYEKRDMPITAEEEEAKARELANFYRICFAHPAVEGILMWGFWEGANWIPQSSLFQRDWTATPAAKAYRDLVFGEWWTRWEGKADANGQCEVPAFFGEHRVTVNGQEQAVKVMKDARTARVKVER